MAKTRELTIHVGARDTASRVIQGVHNNLKGFGASVSGTVARQLAGVGRTIAGAFAGIGKSLLAGVGLGIGMNLGNQLADALKSSIVVGADFEKSMSRVKAIVGATGTEFAALTQSAMDLGAATAFSASEVAGAQGELAAAGFSANQILGATPGVLDLAAAGELSMADAATIAATAIKTFKLNATDMTRVADVLAQAANDSTSSVSQLGESFKFVSPVAAGMGMSIEETVAGLEILADAGLRAEMGGTGFRQVLSDLSGENVAVNNLFRELGLNMATIAPLKLADKIDVLKEKMSGLTKEAQQGKLIKAFGDRGGVAMGAFIAEGGDELRRRHIRKQGAGGAAEEMGKTKRDNVLGDWEQLWGAIETGQIQFFNQTKGPIRDLLQWVTDKIREFVPRIPEVMGRIKVALTDGWAFAKQVGSTVMAYLRTVWDFWKTVVVGIGGGIARLADMAGGPMKLLTIAAPGASAVGGFLAGIIPDVQLFGATWTETLRNIEFLFTNWKDVAEVVWLGIKLKFNELRDLVFYLFERVLPDPIERFINAMLDGFRQVVVNAMKVVDALGPLAGIAVKALSKITIKDVAINVVPSAGLFGAGPVDSQATATARGELDAANAALREKKREFDAGNQARELAARMNQWTRTMGADLQKSGGKMLDNLRASPIGKLATGFIPAIKLQAEKQAASQRIAAALAQGVKSVASDKDRLAAVQAELKGLASESWFEKFAGVAAMQQSRFLSGAGSAARDNAQSRAEKRAEKTLDEQIRIRKLQEEQRELMKRLVGNTEADAAEAVF